MDFEKQEERKPLLTVSNELKKSNENFEEEATNIPSSIQQDVQSNLPVSNDTVVFYESITRIRMDPHSSNFVITCRVCQNKIDVSTKHDQYVVKCLYCSEATPIKSAPLGKKYVRCPCNCLLVCKVASQKIACPRPSCQRVITLNNYSNTRVSPMQPGMCPVLCGHCRQMFLFNTLQNALARCPHCQKVSSVGPQFARGRRTLFLFIGGILYVIVLIASLLTGSVPQHPALSVLYFIMFLIGSAALIRSIYYYTMKVSETQNESSGDLLRCQMPI